VRFLRWGPGPVILSGIAAVLLIYSFQATSSDVTAVTGSMFLSRSAGGDDAFHDFTALCIGDDWAMEQVQGGPDIQSRGSCPKGDVVRKVAVVTSESTMLFAAGVVFLFLSTGWQAALAQIDIVERSNTSRSRRGL